MVFIATGTPPVGYVTDREDSDGPLPYPRLMVGVASLCGVVLLLMLNAILISCCHVRRKQRLRQNGEERGQLCREWDNTVRRWDSRVEGLR